MTVLTFSSSFCLYLLLSTSTSQVQAIVGDTYVLDTEYSGSTFFDGFDFFTGPDPTHGFVSYQSRTSSLSKRLISTTNSIAHMGVDSTTVLNPDGRDGGRESVRISSKKTFTHGLFLADVRHMPGGPCGVWPAYWMFGPDWPNSGEIDIIEGVSLQQTNVMTLHSGDTCNITGLSSLGTLQSSNCNQKHGFGCSITSPVNSPSYGSPFNTANGGIYATHWTSDYIRIWFFPRSSIPSDILNNNPNPDPSSWGLPHANFDSKDGGCDFDANFRDHQIVFDTTFCGDWASAAWVYDDVCMGKAKSCTEYVAGKPEDFRDTYWDINYVKVFTLTDTAPATLTKDISSSQSTSSLISISTSTTTTTSEKATSGLISESSLIASSTSVSSPSTPSTHEPSSPTIRTAFPPFPTSSHNLTILTPPTLRDWSYIGCLYYTTSEFILTAQSGNMTIELCASSCSTSAYLGTFGRSCFCGSEVSEVVIVSDGNCTIPCPGSSTQVCGGMESIDFKNKRDGYTSQEKLVGRQSTAYLLTVYQNQALLTSGIIPSVSLMIPTIQPTTAAGPLEVHFAPTIGEMPTPLSSLVPVSTLIGIGMGETVDSTSDASGVGSSLKSTGTLIDTEMGGGLNTSILNSPSTSASIFVSGKAVETTYTTVLTITYTDICHCAASTLQAYTITSTMTIMHCGCNGTKQSPFHSHTHATKGGTVTQHEIPMTTITRICADCGMDGKVIVTIPCTEPTKPTILPLPTKSESPSTEFEDSSHDDTSRWTLIQKVAGVVQTTYRPRATHVMIEIKTVTILPRPISGNAAVSRSESEARQGNETVIFSNRAKDVGLPWTWGVCALLGVAGAVFWAL